MQSYLDVVRSDHADVLVYYSALRKIFDQPVLFDPSLDGLVVVTFDGCAQVLGGADFAKSDPTIASARALGELDAVMQSHFAAAGANAAARRRYWARRLSTISAVDLERLASELLERVGDAEFDLNRDVLRPYVLRAALRAIDISLNASDVAPLLDAYVGHLDGRQDGGTPRDMYQGYVGLLSAVAGAEPYDGDRLAPHGYQSPQEWVVDMAFVLAAAQESTAFLVGSILAAAQGAGVDLAQHETDRIILEGLRFDSPVQLVGRYARRDTLLAGTRVMAGTRIFCQIGLANRDPAKFDDPDRFDPARGNARDGLGFGSGRWACIGQGIARVQAHVMLEVLCARGARLSLAGLRYQKATAAREFKALPCALAGLTSRAGQ